MTTIEVRIPHHKLLQLEHEVHIANYSARELRKAGVPVDGALFLRARNGVLSTTTDVDGLLFTWVGDRPLEQPVEEESIW